jgi:hypothetical protein
VLLADSCAEWLMYHASGLVDLPLPFVLLYCLEKKKTKKEKEKRRIILFIPFLFPFLFLKEGYSFY